MDHNEISAMYRRVLKDIGVTYDDAPVVRQFWDERIYRFAEKRKDANLPSIRLPLLLDIARGLD